MWKYQSKDQPSNCLITKEDETKLWYNKLGHLNLRSMGKIISEKAINGLSNLMTEKGKMCGDYQIGKQTKMSLKKLQHLTTSKVLELLHMDLMGPM